MKLKQLLLLIVFIFIISTFAVGCVQKAPLPSNSPQISAQISPSALPAAKSAEPSPTASAKPSYSSNYTPKPLVEPKLTQTDSGAFIYTNLKAGFTLQIPADWKGKFGVQEGPEGVTFYNKKTNDNYPIYGGRLFSIDRSVGELTTKEYVANYYAKAKLVAQGNGYSYVASFPTDVQYPYDEDKAISDEYREMQKGIKDIYQSIVLLKIDPPKGTNAGFKVVAGDYFYAEIPQDWEIKLDDNAFMTWRLISGGKTIGSIEMIPYGSDKPISDDKTLRAYALNPKKIGDAKISLSKGDAGQDILDKIKDCIKFVHGGGVLYYLSQANDYIEQGGERIFGKLESDASSYRLTVKIHLYKYIDDGSAKGYHIEDGNQVVSYPVSSGLVSIFPLAPPNYRYYDIYNDQTFLSDSFYEKHKDGYFDFILYKGKIQSGFERYLP